MQEHEGLFLLRCGQRDGTFAPRITLTAGMSCAADPVGGMMAKRKAATRERIDTRVGGTRFVRRRPDGTFKESDQLGPSLAADRRQKAKTKVNSGQGDRGDR